MKAYLDTSALVKLYYPEEETELLSRWIVKNNEAVPLTPFHEIEFQNALSLKIFRKKLTRRAMGKIRRLMEEDLESGVLIRRTADWREIFSKAIQFSRRYTHRWGCRSLDILHVAFAVILECDAMVTFDERQGKLCRASGLKWITV